MVVINIKCYSKRNKKKTLIDRNFLATFQFSKLSELNKEFPAIRLVVRFLL